MNVHLKVWRQAGPAAPGGLGGYTATGVSADMALLVKLGSDSGTGVDKAATRP